YRILLPKSFDATQKYPLHLFLHGSGERGNDNAAQLIHGSQLFLKMRDSYPAIVIFPQCPSEDYWAQISSERNQETNERIFNYPEESEPTWAMSALIQLLDEMLQESYINHQQIYIGGLSMGGMGTFELLARRPNTFAAATPICGGGQPAHVSRWASNTPVWIFHGDDDTVVPSRYSKLMVEALLRNGQEPKFSLYPSVNHNSWDNAFAEPEFFSWVYDQLKTQE
ncbi:MAG: putative peptidase, partial [Gammaproteobacteria bacterium]